MPHLPNNPTLELILYICAAVVVLFVGYRIGRAFGHLAAKRVIDQKEQELFTTQKGFKNLYEQEIAKLKEENASMTHQIETLNARVEDYRKKAAGLGGLFNSGGKKADAMYALLLENEALEEALMSQNEKLKTERTDALKEQMRNTSYRRVLMSQLLNDERIKSYVAEVLADEKLLPGADASTVGAHASAGNGEK
jgi:cell division protein FtsB